MQSQFVEIFGDPVRNPKGWKIVQFLDLGECKNGMNFHAKDSGVTIHCLGVGDFGTLSRIENTAMLPMISLNEMPSQEYLLQDEDIVFVRSNGNKDLVGRCIIVYPQNIPTTFSGFCIRYRKKSHDVNIVYLLYMLKIDSVRRLMAGRGINITNLSQQVMKKISVPLPPLDIQERFAAFVEQSDKSKFELGKALAELTATYKSIIKENLG